MDTQELATLILDGIKQVAKKNKFTTKLPFTRSPMDDGMYGYILIKYQYKKIRFFATGSEWDKVRVHDHEIKIGELSMDKDIFQKIVSLLQQPLEEIFFGAEYPLMFKCKAKFHLRIDIDDKEQLRKFETYEQSFRLHDAKLEATLKDNFYAFVIALSKNFNHAMKENLHVIHFHKNLLEHDISGYSCEQIQSIINDTIENNLDKRNQKVYKYFINSGMFHLEKWVQRNFKAKYFIDKYTVKKDIELSDQDLSALELYVFTLYLRIKHNDYPSLALEELEVLSKDLGSKTAKQYLKEGTGTFDTKDTIYKDKDINATANDVTATITIKLKSESEEVYAKAMQYIINLIKIGFPKGYKIKLSGASKEFLPIKLNKSSSHKFFANVLRYPNLHPLLEEYALVAMQEFEWYTDVSEEKACMPGSYAVFGLGLTSEKYFALVQKYFELLDDEHQSVHKHFVDALVDHYGVTPTSIDIIIQGIISSQNEHNHKNLKKLLKDKNNRAIFEKGIQKLDVVDERLTDL